MSADSIILTIFQELITHGYNEVCNRDALKMWGIPKLLYSTMAGDSEHTHQGQYVSATRAGTRTILCTSLASGSSTVPNTKYRHRIKSRCQTPLWPSAASEQMSDPSVTLSSLSWQMSHSSVLHSRVFRHSVSWHLMGPWRPFLTWRQPGWTISLQIQHSMSFFSKSCVSSFWSTSPQREHVTEWGSLGCKRTKTETKKRAGLDPYHSASL